MNLLKVQSTRIPGLSDPRPHTEGGSQVSQPSKCRSLTDAQMRQNNRQDAQGTLPKRSSITIRRRNHSDLSIKGTLRPDSIHLNPGKYNSQPGLRKNLEVPPPPTTLPTRRSLLMLNNTIQIGPQKRRQINLTQAREPTTNLPIKSRKINGTSACPTKEGQSSFTKLLINTIRIGDNPTTVNRDQDHGATRSGLSQR